jgi:LCP family protein required for cell wall assembly
LAATPAKADVAHGIRLGLRFVAALCSLLVLLGSGLAWATYRNFTTDINRVDVINRAGKGGIDGKDQNILIVGNDDRETATDGELSELGTTRDQGSLNTDTMMLMHVPADGSKASAISFPRDSYVEIPGHNKNKLNSAYTTGIDDAHGDKAGGARLLVKTIEALTTLSIDHFVQVDLIGFYRISNAIGGVDVCLNAAQNPETDSDANGKGYSGIDLKAGHNLIQGKQALAFVRQRHGLPGGDLDRIKRQQYFLSAVFRKMSSAGTLLNPFKLQKLLKAVSTSLQMDKSLDPLKLAQQMQNLQAGNFKFTTIPTSGNTENEVGSVVVVDYAAIPDFIDSLVGTSAADALKSAEPADPGSFTVDVLNGSGVDARATKNAGALKSAGFHTNIPTTNQSLLAATTIRYAPGEEGAAKALAAQVPGAVVVRSHEAKNVTLILGGNNLQVKSLMPATPTKTPSKAPSPPASGANAQTTAADAGCIN